MSQESITVVFSTREDNPDFIHHIKQTCGLENVEILQFINRGEYSLTELYNRGLREAKNTIIVFSHDDVIFEQSDAWGQKIIQHFHNSDFGILGKAGTTSITGSGRWWEEFHLMVGEVWHQQTDQGTGETITWENQYSGNFGDKIIETILVDGLFFAVHRERIGKEFDENIKSFHFYDIDFSFANHIEGVKVGVIFNIKIIHKSIGITNEQWENNRIFFVNKWKSRLPYRIEPPILYEDLTINCKETPKVAIVILTKDTTDILFACIDSFMEKTQYENYSIYIADTGSSVENFNRVKNYISQKNNIVLFQYPGTPASVNNDVVRNHIDHDTDLLLFCHDDIKLLNDALSRCIQLYLENKKETGTIGIRLHLGDKSIQHAGILLMVDKENRLKIKYKGYKSYYSYHPGIEPDIFSNIGAFMMVNKDFFLSLGGFSENYGKCLEDIEFNLRSILAGRINYFIGDAVAYHYELETRMNDSDTLARQGEDLKRLLVSINQNINNPKIMKHLRFINM